MSETSATPWKAGNEDFQGMPTTIIAADGEMVAHLWHPINRSRDTTCANAALVAAAPEMLRVLLEIREDLLCGGECRHVPSGVQGSILAAISKALGET